MKKILLLSFFLLNLLSVITQGTVTFCSSTASAQSYGNEGLWLDEVDVSRYLCTYCKESFKLESERNWHERLCDVTACQFCKTKLSTVIEKEQHELTCPSANPSDEEDHDGINDSNDDSSDQNDPYTSGGETWPNTDNNGEKIFFTIYTNGGGYQTLEGLLNWAGKASGKIKNILDKLYSQGKIILIDNGQFVARYDPANKSIYLPKDLSVNNQSVTHEVCHYIQDQLGVLDYDNHCSENEYQAYLVNYILHNALKKEEYIVEPMGVKTLEKWDDFKNILSTHCRLENNKLYYDRDFLEILNRPELHDVLFQAFRNSCAAGGKPASYYMNSNLATYDWKWKELLEALGFELRSD